jgi:hypothetical protein
VISRGKVLSMRFVVCALLLFLPAIVQGQKVSVEFDEAATFSDYKTFTLRNGQIHSQHPSLNNELTHKKIDGEIRKHLLERGLTEVTSRPDLNVFYSLGSARRREVDAYPAGWRGYGTVRVAHIYTEGTLVLDLRDAKKHALVWRAIAVEDKDDPIKIQEHLDDMVRKSIEKYPPKKK